MFDLLQEILVVAIPVILAITLHEAAHGYAARILGDDTAWRAGRISINPLRHVDPIGTLLVPGVIFLLSYFSMGKALLFGWAKPVPVDFSRLRHPKRDMFWVAIAGPAINFVQALAWALALKFLTDAGHGSTMRAFGTMHTLGALCVTGIQINGVLMLFNLLPIPPLDGGRIAVSLLPYPASLQLARLERFGMLIVVALLASGIFDWLLWPLLDSFFDFIVFLFRLN